MILEGGINAAGISVRCSRPQSADGDSCEAVGTIPRPRCGTSVLLRARLEIAEVDMWMCVDGLMCTRRCKPAVVAVCDADVGDAMGTFRSVLVATASVVSSCGPV
jgi:hypothetical protein